MEESRTIYPGDWIIGQLGPRTITVNVDHDCTFPSGEIVRIPAGSTMVECGVQFLPGSKDEP